MKFVKADDLLDKAQHEHKAGNFDEADKIYNVLLSKSLGNPSLLFLLGTLHMQKGNHGLAIELLSKSVEKQPDFGPAWNNLAICLKKEDHNQSADYAFEQAEKYMNTPDIPSNRSSIYVNNGTPDKCLLHAERALKIDPEHMQSKWHKALALLEMQRWDEAWEWHESRLHPESGCNVEKRNYQEDGETPWWDGKSKGLVVIHGEQGLGDEIMFASCIPDALKTCAEFVIECNPRLEGLFKRSFPKCRVYGTHKTDGSEWRNGQKVDFKIALGSLPKFFRNSESDFPGNPYLKADPEKALEYRDRLDSISNRPKIGIAWQGGVIRTRVDLRSIHLPNLKSIFDLDADFISLQYHKSAQDDINELFERTELKIHHWDEAATGRNMDDQAALISQLDAVVTVCQTAVHVSGALGVPTIVLTPSRPSWRYGVTGNMPWYESVDLYRQDGNDWKPTIERARCSLQSLIESKTRNFTKQASLA